MAPQTRVWTYFDKLVVALDHPEPTTRVRAAWVLGRLGERRAVAPLLEALARERHDAEFVATVAESLGILRDEASIPALIELTRYSFLKARLAAVEALGQWRAQAVVAKALDAARSDVNAIVRRAAARNLRSAARQ